jgi:hypothetical protein
MWILSEFFIFKFVFKIFYILYASYSRGYFVKEMDQLESGLFFFL